tara:strand:+ start:147 stop:2501 length:2355 start_codon:yes stop_codon:yes gene_type:complete
MAKKNQGASIDEIKKAMAEQAKADAQAAKAIVDATKAEEARAKAVQKVADAQDDITSSIQDSVKQLSNATSAQKNMFKSTSSVADLEKQIAANAKQLNTAKKLGNSLDTTGLKATQDRLKEQLSIVNAQQASLKHAQGLNSVLQKQAASIVGFVQSMPGGDMLVKGLGIDKLGAGIEEGLSSAVSVMSKGGSLSQGVSAFSGSLTAALGPIGMITIAIAGLAMIFTDISKKAQAFSKETGITFSQARLLGKEASELTASLSNSLSSTKDIKDVLSESIKEFGVLNMLSAEQAMNVSEIGKAFGYGAAEAAKVNNIFQQMGASADDAADAQRELAAEALKSGLNVGAVVKDISTNAKATAKFFGGNVKALKKAAIEAAKLGMSIATMAKVSSHLLDFESSISAQFEFQALTGKQLNLDTARQLALQGDIAGATKLIMDQVGTSADLTAMNVIEREALAKATGMEFEELQRSVMIQEKLKNLTAEQRADAANLGLSAAQMKDMTAEQLQDAVANQQANEKMSLAFDSMKSTLVNALMPAAQAMMEIFGALSPVLKVISMMFQGIGFFITGFLTPITFLVDMLGQAKDFVGGILENFGFLSPVVTGLGLMFDFIKETLMYTGMVLGTIFLPNILALIPAAISMAGGFISSAIGALFSAFGMIPFGLGVPLAIGAVAGLMSMVGKAMSVGDMGIDPNGGPIVTSPGLGGVFQGKKQDGLSMGPGMGTDPSTGASSTSGGGSINIDYQRMAQAIVKAMAGVTVRSAPIQIGAQVINAISDQIDVNKSYL